MNWAKKSTLWGLPVLFLAFLFTGATATWFGPDSHSFVAMIVNGFLLVSILVASSALPVPRSWTDQTARDEDES